MKKIILISAILLLPSFLKLFSFSEDWASVSIAQVLAPPEGINYQAVARDTSGKPLNNSINLVVRFTIWDSTAGIITNVFTETHSPVNTNRYGLFTLVIGSVETSDFSNIVWAIGDKLLEVEIATVGGASYISMGKTRMMSAPFSLHSKSTLFAYGNWGLQGNNLTDSTNFIGTNDLKDLVIKTDSIERMRVTSSGDIGIGTTAPLSKLDVSGGIAIGTNYSGITSAPANGAIIEGNVGIGTSAPDPAAMLDLAGQIKITGGSPGTGKVLTSDATGLATWTPSDSGTVSSFSSNSLAPLFTTTVSTPTTTPALSFALSNAAAYTILGNNTGASAAPGYFSPILASSLFQNQGTSTTVLHGNAGAPTWAQIVNADIANNTIDLTSKVIGVLPIANGGTNAGIVGPAGSVPYSNATAYVFSAAGTSGQVLTSGGTGAPTWTTPPSGTVTAVTGITPIFSTGGATPSISVASNSQSSPGVVAAGGSNNDMVWKTNGSGVPAWRNDSSIAYSAGTGLSLSGTTFNSVWTQLGTNIFSNNAGNVGIGVSSPTAKLQVLTAGAVDGFNSSTFTGTGSLGVFGNYNVSNSSSTLSSITNGSGPALFATTTGSGNAGLFSISNTGSVNHALYSETNGSGNAIYGKNTSTGKAGTFEVLNAASTSDVLYVTTNGSSSKSINVSHTGAVAGSTDYGTYVSNTGAGTTNVGGYFTASGAANNYAGIFDQGNVGIGTTSPTSKLEINGQITITGGSPGSNKVLTSDGSGLASWSTLGSLGSVGASGSAGYIPKFVTSTSLANSNIFDTGTNIGIGTTTPTSKLHVSGGFTRLENSQVGFTNLLTLLNPAAVNPDYGAQISFSGTVAATTMASIESGWNATATTNAYLRFDVRNSNVMTEAMRIASTGNVGIGTTTPGAGLVVSGSAIWASAIGIQNTTAGMEWRMTTAADGTFNLVKLTGSTFTAMTVNPTVGNVGIGTTTPVTNARLAIKDGHLQSQQTTAPTVIAATTYVLASQSLSNATDIAGNISILTTAAAGNVTIDFNKDYSVAPIVTLTATNNFSASDMTKVWITSTISGFTINFSDSGGLFPPTATTHTYSYYVIETQ